MMKILEEAGYPRMDALKKIIADHKDLDGFSQATIYRQLPGDMKAKQLGRPNLSRDKLGQPNDAELEELGNTEEGDITEEEETTTTETEPEVIYDPSLLNKHIKEIAKLQEENAKLKIERIPTRANKSDFRYEMEFTDEMFLLIKANSGICPLISTSFPGNGDGYIRFDKEKIQQEIKKTQKAKAK